jgi:hypothetical protein
MLLLRDLVTPKRPIFAIVIVLVLVLGFAGTVAVPALQHLLEAPLPFREPDQLYRLYTTPSTSGDDKIAAIELSDLTMKSHAIAGAAAFTKDTLLTYSDSAHTAQWSTIAVSATFFQVLGLQPILGRAFIVEDFFKGNTPTVIISDEVWRRDFGGQPTIIGKTIHLDRKPFVVIAVVPAKAIRPTFDADALLALDVDEALRNSNTEHLRIWRSVVRARPGVSMKQLQHEIDSLRPGFEQKYPDIKGAGTFIPKPLRETIP